MTSIASITLELSFGGRYVEFDTPDSPIKVALYGCRALAKDAGVAPHGTGSHRIAISGDAGTFTDPDGFAWETDLGTAAFETQAAPPTKNAAARSAGVG